MSEWTAGPRVDFQMLKDTIIGLQERIGVLEEQTHRYDRTDKRLDNLEATQQRHREWLQYTDGRLDDLDDKYAGMVEEIEEIEPSVEYKRFDMKLKVCGAKSDGIDEHTCINPALHETHHQCECGETWSVVRKQSERTATVLLTNEEYRSTRLADAVDELEKKLLKFGKREHIRIGEWQPTFTTVDGIMCPAWILKGIVAVNYDA